MGSLATRSPATDNEGMRTAAAPPVRQDPARRGDSAIRPPLELLLVDDCAYTRRLVERVLDRHSEVHCEVVGTVALARERLAAQRFDVVLIDLFIDHDDGCELMDWAREHPFDCKHPPKLYAITGCASGEQRERCLRAGAEQVFVKPIAFDVLLATLDTHDDLHPRPLT